MQHDEFVVLAEYNTLAEAEALVQGLHRVVRMLR